MEPKTILGALGVSQQFFDRSTSALTEADSGFAPSEGMFTVAQSVAHVAGVIDWFVEGAFEREEGFSLDFEALDAEAKAVTSLEAARGMLTRAYDRAREVIGAQPAGRLMEPLPAGPIMGGMPRFSILGGIEDHTAHHRGALAVYTRMCGHTPPMPYEGESAECGA